MLQSGQKRGTGRSIGINMSIKKSFKAIEFNWEGHYDHQTVNDFAYLHSSSFQSIFGKPKKSVDNISDCEGYLCVRRNGRKIYLRYKSAPVVKGDEVMLSYHNLAILRALTTKGEAPAEVTISPSSYFRYMLCNQKSEVAWAFRLSVISILISVVSLICTFL